MNLSELTGRSSPPLLAAVALNSLIASILCRGFDCASVMIELRTPGPLTRCLAAISRTATPLSMRRSRSARIARPSAMSFVMLRQSAGLNSYFSCELFIGEQPFPGSRAVDDELASHVAEEVDRSAAQRDYVAHGQISVSGRALARPMWGFTTVRGAVPNAPKVPYRPARPSQPFQKSLNRVGDSSVYRTVCWMFLWPR